MTRQPTEPDAVRAWPRERLALLGLVFVGGALGTAVRAFLSEHIAAGPEGWPWVTFGINVTGALMLGLLLGVLARLGDNSGRRRHARLGVGTGVLGGFTTYSTFAVEVVERQQDSLAIGLGYAAASCLLGVLAAVVGLRLAARR